MNRRRIWWMVGFMALVVIVVCAYISTNPQPLQLRFVGRTVKEGKPVVILRVEGGFNRRFMFTSYEILTGEWSIPTPEPCGNAVTSATPDYDFWDLTHKAIVNKLLQTPFEFPVRQSSLARSWRLRVGVTPEVSLLKRFKEMPSTWTAARNRRLSLFQAIAEGWNGFYQDDTLIIESDWITNTVPVLSEASK